MSVRVVSRETFFTVSTLSNVVCDAVWVGGVGGGGRCLPEVLLHEFRKGNHGVRTTNLYEFDDTGGGRVELHFTTLESVVGGAVTPRNVGRGHNVSNVDIVTLKEAHVLGCPGLIQHNVVLNRCTGLILNLVLVNQFAKSMVFLQR